MTFIREQYLQDSLTQWRKIFRSVGYKIPAVHITVAPMGRATGGLCYERAHSSDRRNHILISTMVTDTDRLQEILAHEAIHALLDCADGHRGQFQVVARSVGFTRPWTQASGTEQFQEYSQCVQAVVGRYRSPKFSAGALVASKN